MPWAKAHRNDYNDPGPPKPLWVLNWGVHLLSSKYDFSLIHSNGKPTRRDHRLRGFVTIAWNSLFSRHIQNLCWLKFTNHYRWESCMLDVSWERGNVEKTVGCHYEKNKALKIICTYSSDFFAKIEMTMTIYFGAKMKLAKKITSTNFNWNYIETK